VTTHAIAVIENGQIKLSEPLALPENTKVQVTIAPLDSDRLARVEAVKSMFAIFDEHPIYGGTTKFSREELYDRY
jgi:hypothetical protein